MGGDMTTPTEELIGKLEAEAFNPTGDDRMGKFVCLDKAIAIIRQHFAAQAYDPHHPDVTFGDATPYTQSVKRTVSAMGTAQYDVTYTPAPQPPAPKCLLCDTPAAALCHFPQGCTCSPIKYQWRCLHHIVRADGTKEAFTIVESFSPEIAAEQPPAIQGEIPVVLDDLRDSVVRVLARSGIDCDILSIAADLIMEAIKSRVAAPKPVTVSLKGCVALSEKSIVAYRHGQATKENAVHAVLDAVKKQGAQFDVQD
jgi:hypothetical protein